MTAAETRPGPPRTDVSFSVEGARCAAWLYRPEGEEPAPCVVLAHGFGATREMRLDAFAERFAAAGFAALVFDYRHFGASEGEPRQLLDIGRQLADWSAAVAWVREQPRIDPDRIVLWGSSFSGGHVIATAAGDARVAAVIAQVPFVDGLATLRQLPPLTAVRLTLAGLRDEYRRRRGGRPFTVAIVGPPGAVAAMSTPDAEPGYRALLPPGVPFNDRVAGGIALRLALYRPGRKAARVRCPLLISVGTDDAITPPEPARRAAAAAPRGELVEYPIGHFEAYQGAAFERGVTDQTAFLGRVLA